MVMKTIVAMIQGKEYVLACDAGQEQHLNQLVTLVNKRADELTKSVGKLAEPMMLLYTALMVADELSDVNRENAKLKEELAVAKRQLSEPLDDSRVIALEEGMAESLTALAGRIEGIADKLSA